MTDTKVILIWKTLYDRYKGNLIWETLYDGYKGNLIWETLYNGYNGNIILKPCMTGVMSIYFPPIESCRKLYKLVSVTL